MDWITDFNLERLKGKPRIRDLFLFYHFYRLLRGETSGEDAAKFLGIQKSVLYRKLDELEQQLCPGRRLVNRESGRASTTTKGGDEFFKRLERLLPFYIDTVAQDRFGQPFASVGATNALNTYFLPLVLKYTDFFKHHPDAELNIHEGEWWEILKDLRQERIGLGVGPEVGQGAKFESRRLYTLRRVVLYHPDHASFRDVRADAPFDLQRLANETVLLLPEWVMPDFELDDVLPRPTPGVGRRVVLPNFAEVEVWVKHDLGVGIGHDQHFTPGDDEYDLIRRVPVKDLGVTPIHLYLRTGGLALTETERDLAACIEKTAAAVAADPERFATRFGAHSGAGRAAKPKKPRRGE